MKITKDTKIGDLIPEEMELGMVNGEGSNMITIEFKKKEEKNFEWYIDEYFNNGSGHYSYIRNGIKSDVIDIYKAGLQVNYGAVPFEIKIGLLKFICKKMKYNLFSVIHSIHTYGAASLKITNIIPVEFLESIFK
jgi:hypothetical protein